MDTGECRFTTALLAVCVVLVCAVPVTAQTYTYQFSSCSAGVSVKLVIPIQIAMGPTTSSNGIRTYSYDSFSATATLTVNGSSKTASGIDETTITYTPDSPSTQSQTGLDFIFSSFDPAAGTVSVLLAGPGDLLSNGLTASLPPVSAWNLPNLPPNSINVIVVNGQYYPVDAYDCSAPPDSGVNAGKALGDPSDDPGCAFCGEPVNLGTGNVFEQVTDYQTAGPNPLAFIRYYNSLAAPATFANTLGSNWRSNYDRALRIVSASSVIAERGDGQQVTFMFTGAAWTSDTDVSLTLANSGASWILTDAQDTIETYNVAAGSSQGVLQSIRARNGYTQNLQYSGAFLTAVNDSFNRQLTFAYAGNLLQSVTTPDGLVLTYGYTGSQLTSVSYSTSPPSSQIYLYENAALPTALTGIIDENGNRYTSWTFDSKGRALTNQHAGGAEMMSVAYNDSDGSRTVTNALGEQEAYKYTILQGVPKVAEIDRLASDNLPAATRKFTYNANGYLASQTDWNGYLTTYVNDSRGQPTIVNEAVGTPQARSTTIQYLSNFRLPSLIMTSGLTTAFTYDTNGQLLTKTLRDITATTAPYSTTGQTRTWTYTWSNSLMASAQAPAGGLTRYTYDSSGALIATTNALGQSTSVAQHLPGGLPQTTVDANGVTTNLAYDARLRLVSSTIQTASGPMTTSYTYDAAGNLLSVTQPDGSTTTNTYDAAHRLTGVTDLLGQSISYTLDAQGDRTLTVIADAAGNLQRTHSASFDPLGRLLVDTGGAGQTTTYVYDSNGNMISVTDPLQHTTRRMFDPLNRVMTVTDAAGGVVTTSYDAHDRPVSVTDPNGGVTRYIYDGFGDTIQRASPDSGATVYRYDADGNQTQRVNGTGATTNNTYDALDRVQTVSYPGDSAENVAYTYDQGNFGTGRLTGITDAAGSLAISYDERGNLLSETRTNGTATLASAYTYDAASRLASVVYPSGWTASYVRDAMGRVTSIAAQTPDGSAAIPVLSKAGYQPFGPLNAMTFGNGVAETRVFDSDYRVTGLADAGTAPLQSLTYAYDAADNVSSIADGVTPGNSQSFGYDVLNRLTSAAGGYGSFAYTYDSAGNRLTQSSGGSSTVYAYTAHSNQLAAIDGGGMKQAVGYDAAGNANAFNPGSGPFTNAVYNQAGRLASIMSGTNMVAQYTYDAFGHRASKTGSVTATTFYQYNTGGKLIEEAGQGNPIVDYIYLDDIPVATISPGGSQVYWLHDDRLGTPQSATDSSQNIVWTASYGPFGETSTVPGLIVQNLRMPGQEFDIDSGLYHNGFRDYVPGWGRYLESDPAGLAGGINAYGYAGANPVKSVDPLGLCTLSNLWCRFKQTYESGNQQIDQFGQHGDVLSTTLGGSGALFAKTGLWDPLAAIGSYLKPSTFANGVRGVAALSAEGLVVSAGVQVAAGAALTYATYNLGLKGGNALASAFGVAYDVFEGENVLEGNSASNCPQ